MEMNRYKNGYLGWGIVFCLMGMVPLFMGLKGLEVGRCISYEIGLSLWIGLSCFAYYWLGYQKKNAYEGFFAFLAWVSFGLHFYFIYRYVQALMSQLPLPVVLALSFLMSAVLFLGISFFVFYKKAIADQKDSEKKETGNSNGSKPEEVPKVRV